MVLIYSQKDISSLDHSPRDCKSPPNPSYHSAHFWFGGLGRGVCVWGGGGRCPRGDLAGGRYRGGNVIKPLPTCTRETIKIKYCVGGHPFFIKDILNMWLIVFYKACATDMSDFGHFHGPNIQYKISEIHQ